MNPTIERLDLATLSPVEKMELADVLYDTAQQELEARTSPLSTDQMREVERRIDDADRDARRRVVWEGVYARLQRRG